MTLTVHPHVEQRSEEWYALRRGMVTASAVKDLLSSDTPDPRSTSCEECAAPEGMPCISLTRKTPTPIKTFHDGRRAKVADLPSVIAVADSKESASLTNLLVAERITGHTDPSFVSSDMWRGIEHEPIARDVYSGHYQQAVEVGFMVRQEDGWTLGYSPDGLVADDGLVEIKCPRSKTHLATILADKVPSYYMAQCQAALLVSGRKWLDYVSFCGGMPLFVKRVPPDPEWHAAIEAACRQFETTAAEMVAAYEQKTAGLPKTERVMELEMSL